MLKWSAIFLVIALASAFFAYGDIETQAAMIAKSIFFLFVALFVLTIFGMPVRR
jgi:uncharacterized membrane protein YtjA (UPF0391 family)